MAAIQNNLLPIYGVISHEGTVWIIENKGREELDLPQKMERLKQWCANVTAAEGNGTIYNFVFVDQESLEKHTPKAFADLITSFIEYKTSL
jgi:type III restriction enzyme